jgi:RNA polymerase sigma factor (sigma-70 family)
LLGETSDRAETRSQEESDAAVGSPESRKRAASALIETHDRVFRRTARRYSICADDAEDAYQRALEILLTKAPPIEGDSLVRWMQTVTKREALAVRRLRERLLGSPRIPGVEDVDERDPLDSIASDRPEPEDRAGSRERVTRSREALRALKPQELRALTLKAEGYSYAEIGEITGWTYTKINRCMAEGRKRFLQAFADIEQGRRCEELAAALSQLADGESPKGSTEALEFHLRGCAGCRATLRAYRTVPQRALELMPIVPAVDQSIVGRPHEWIAHHAGAALDKVREASYSLLVRGGGAGDAAPLASAGGTRGAGMAVVAKALALCGATAAGGAACVASGVVEPGALGVGSGGEKAAIERPADPTADVVPDETVLPTPDPVEPAASDDQQEVAAETPVQEQSQQFSIEAAPSGSGSSAGGNEFAGPSGGGGGSGGGGSGAQGFGIE